MTIGNFDGVHRGHQALLAHLVDAARTRGLQAAVMTFEPHPREFFAPERAPARVSNLRDKLNAFGTCGVQRVFVMHFNRRLAQLAPAAFVEDALLIGCAMRSLLVGADFRFGAARAGDVALLSDYAKRGAFELEIMPTVEDAGDRISSTGVRQALMGGDLTRANALLARPYAISGRVMHGRKLGASLGFPTLNLRIEHAHPALARNLRGSCARPGGARGARRRQHRPATDGRERWAMAARSAPLRLRRGRLWKTGEGRIRQETAG